MINSIPKIELENKRNSFETVSRNTDTSRYWQMPANDAATANANANANANGSALGASIIMTPKEAQKTHNLRNIGLSIAGTTILITAGVFFFLKGGSKGFQRGLESLRGFFEERIQKSKLTQNVPPKILSIYEFIVRKTDGLIKRSEILNNYTTIKDYSLKRLMCNKKNSTIFSKIHNGITGLFQKIAKKTVLGSYKKTQEMFTAVKPVLDRANGEILSSNFSEIVEINGVKKTKLQWLEVLMTKHKDMVADFSEYFSPKRVDARFKRLKCAALQTEREFDKKGFFWFLSKNTLKSFVAENSMLAKKTKIKENIIAHRRNISYSLADMASDAEQTVIKLASTVDYKDGERLQLLRNIRKGFKDLTKNNSGVVDEYIQQKLLKNLEELKVQSLKSQAPEEVIDMIDSLLNFKNFKQGKVEDILDIYKVLLPKDKFEKVNQAYKLSMSSLDRAITTETEDFVNKLRDLTLGSAPTDIITILSGFVTLGYFLGKSDDYRQRTSVALKYGIPALVGIGTTLYGNAKLFAGSKSLLFGAISMWLTNKAGSLANTLLNNYWDKQQKAQQNPIKIG